jgi:uncharacterized damage-inducible protein DinB
MHTNSNDALTQHLRELFEYNSNCNQQVIELINSNPDTCPQKAVSLLHHTLNAHHIWNARIKGIASQFGVWEIHASEQLHLIDKDNKSVTETIILHSQFVSSVSYQNMKGETFTNAIVDILFHIINHSTYHRGQIQSELKNVDISPASLDYIFYKRTVL